MIQKIGKYAIKLTSKNPWTNVYGLARSILALGTLLTLLFNPTYNLFRPAAGITDYPICTGVSGLSMFCILPSLEIARWLAIIILLVVMSGWRPRYTGVLHWWVVFSLQISAIVIDGGDQVASILALLLVPVTLTDSRKWHWQTQKQSDTQKPILHVLSALFAITALLAVRLQASIIYFHAAVGKFTVEEWLDGTILYYWLHDPSLGLPAWLQFLLPIFSTRLVVLFTWGTLLLEILLFMALLMPQKYWKPLLVAGIIFHAGIALMMGLFSFGCSMTAILIVYLRPFDQVFNLKKISAIVQRLLGILRNRSDASNDSSRLKRRNRFMKHFKFFGGLFTILMVMVGVNAQIKSKPEGQPKDVKAQEVLALAQKAIYKDIEPSDIKSLYFETKGTLVVDSTVSVEGTKNPKTTNSRLDIEEATSVLLSDKIKHMVTTRDAYKNPIENFTTVTMISNGDDVFFDSRRVVNGKLFDLNAVLNSANVPEATKKRIRAQQAKTRAAITKESITKTVAGKILPYLLYNPWENDEKFIYVGKAVAGETKADVLEIGVPANNKKKIRFFFDENTHLLLLVTQEVDNKDVDSKSSYYFSNYTEKSGMLIASKINLETTSTTKRKNGDKFILTTTKAVSEVATSKFEINPVLKASTFMQQK